MPDRICSLLSSATEMLFLLGLENRVVAVSHECDYPVAANQLPRVSRTRIDPSLSSNEIDVQVKSMLAAGEPLYELCTDEIVALRPLLIVTQAQCDVCAIRHEDVLDLVRNEPALADCQVLALNPMSIADVLHDIARIGKATGCDERAVEVIAALQQRIDLVKERTSSLTNDQRPRVACIEWTDPPMLGGNWIPQMIDWAGGQQSLAKPGQHSDYVSWETICAFAPEVVLVMPCGQPLDRAIAETHALAKLTGWRDLPAVRNRRVFAIDGNAYFNRSGPRLVDSLELLAQLVQPGLFAASLDTARCWQFE